MGTPRDRCPSSEANTSEEEVKSDGIVTDCEENHDVNEIASFHH